MKKSLFITGPIQTGKSTMLQHVLEPYGALTGGFISQRLMDETGKTRGFRLTDYREKPSLTAPYSSSLPDIFMEFGNPKKMNLSVFETKGVEILQKAMETRSILLMDEIGGVELLSAPFKDLLYEALETSTCIGILKAEESLLHMHEDVRQAHKELLSHLSRLGTVEILNMDAASPRIIENFIRNRI